MSVGSKRPQGLESRLNDVLIDRYQDGENAGYPTLCKGRYLVDGERYHALEEPTSLNTLELLPELMAANIASVKIEGRQRSPAYVSQVAKVVAPGDRSLQSRPAKLRSTARLDGDARRDVRRHPNHAWRISP
ncbi:protease [Salmonella enterica subsp. enterica]|uniref:Protease n=1 Tax=Salmonella enterica I TaxID=59201 RepID=A0A3S5DMF2_SALET|nr:protease [Salmonella enterica subsp. enterica]